MASDWLAAMLPAKRMPGLKRGEGGWPVNLRATRKSTDQ